tara:strand:- start:296 stop:1024 length:729 start_codon:yes stop_codon:yes gene_type:complete
MSKQDIFYLKIEANKYFERNIAKAEKDITKKNNLIIRPSKKEIYKILNKNIKLKNKRILEIGSFISDLLFFLKKKHTCKVYGIEPSSLACQFAREKYNLFIENKTFYKSKFFSSNSNIKNKFDVIICDDILSWVDRSLILETVSKIDSLLKENGFIFFRDFSPNRNIAVRNHHHKGKNIFNYKVEDGHKSFFLLSGKYKKIYSRKFTTNKFQINRSRSKETNVWCHDLLKKYKKNNYRIVSL